MAGDVRKECTQCGVHTFRSQCGNCGSAELRLVKADPEPDARFARERRSNLASVFAGRGMRSGSHSY